MKISNAMILFCGLTPLPISGTPEQWCRTIPTTFYL